MRVSINQLMSQMKLQYNNIQVLVGHYKEELLRRVNHYKAHTLILSNNVVHERFFSYRIQKEKKITCLNICNGMGTLLKRQWQSLIYTDHVLKISGGNRYVKITNGCWIRYILLNSHMRLFWCHIFILQCFLTIFIILFLQYIDSYLIILRHTFPLAKWTCVEMSFDEWLPHEIKDWEKYGFDNYQWSHLLLYLIKGINDLNLDWGYISWAYVDLVCHI